MLNALGKEKWTTQTASKSGADASNSTRGLPEVLPKTAPRIRSWKRFPAQFPARRGPICDAIGVKAKFCMTNLVETA